MVASLFGLANHQFRLIQGMCRMPFTAADFEQHKKYSQNKRENKQHRNDSQCSVVFLALRVKLARCSNLYPTNTTASAAAGSPRVASTRDSSIPNFQHNVHHSCEYFLTPQIMISMFLVPCRFASSQSTAVHDESGYLTYKYASLLAFPILGYLFYKNIIVAEHETPPQYVDYSHLHVMRKVISHVYEISLGDGTKSLFYNPHMQGRHDDNEEQSDKHQPLLTQLMADHAGVRGASETREAHVERVRRQSDAVVRRSRQANFLFPGPIPETVKSFSNPKM
eukprot:gene1320-6_t